MTVHKQVLPGRLSLEVVKDEVCSGVHTDRSMYVERFRNVGGHDRVSKGQGATRVDTGTFVVPPTSHARSKHGLLIGHGFSCC